MFDDEPKTDDTALQPQIVDVSVVEQLTRGEVDMQVATAKRFPRSLQRFSQEAKTLCLKNPSVAASCFYVLPRGGKRIEGPSIRLAEIVAAAWGNLRCETRIVSTGETLLTAQATCWDMERNVLMRVETQRRITDRKGNRFSDDMLVVTGNAAASIALRNAIFKIVPGAFVQELMAQCKRVAAQGAEGGLDGARKKWIAEFTKRGVTEAQVLEMLGKQGLADIDIDDVVTLQGLHTALSEGQTTIEEIFPSKLLENGTGSFGFKKAARVARKASGEAPGNVAEEPPPEVEPPPGT